MGLNYSSQLPISIGLEAADLSLSSTSAAASYCQLGGEVGEFRSAKLIIAAASCYPVQTRRGGCEFLGPFWKLLGFEGFGI